MLASGESASADVMRHVGSCADCRERLRIANEDASFLTRVRSLAEGGLPPVGSPRIPGYGNLSIISSGSQGVVYRAVQESTSRAVAIKVMIAGDAASSRQRARAEREAEISASLRHPNIVSVFESRRLGDGRVAVIMEYVDGVPIDRWVPPGAGDEPRRRAILNVFLEVCNAIHYAHLKGVIHRDLKPDNVLVTADGRPVVLDFGIAKAGGIRTTRTGEFAGTPAYASPEQVLGKSEDIDALSDVYSLGVVLYRLLCGRMPYSVEGSIFDIARTIGTAEPGPMRFQDNSIPSDLEAIVRRALQKDKQFRYQSAAALARDIQHYLAGAPVDARSGSGWYVLRKAISLNRRRLAWAGAALALMTAAAATVGISIAKASAAARRANEQREQAREENVRARAVAELLREALPSTDPERPEIAAAVNSGLTQLYMRLETGGFSDDPELDQALRRMWGEVYTGLGSGKSLALIEYSEVSLRNGLMKLRAKDPSDRAEIASTMHELAAVLLMRRRAPEAEQMCLEALAMRRRLLGEASIPVAESRALLATIRLSLDKPQQAEADADAALASFRAMPPPQGDVRMASMIELKAKTRGLAGDWAGAAPLVREALECRLRHLAPDDPDLLSSLGSAAAVVEKCPESTLAIQMSRAWEVPVDGLANALRRDIRIFAMPDRRSEFHTVISGRTEALGRLRRLQESFLGDFDPSIVRTLIVQMRAGQVEGKIDVCAKAAQRMTQILERRFGEYDQSVLVSLEKAATFLAFTNDFESAIECGRRAVAIWQSFPEGVRDPLPASNCRRLLGWYYSLAGRCDEALAEYRIALEQFRATVGNEHHLVALTQANIAFCLAQTGRIAEADALSKVALEAAVRLPAIPQDALAHAQFARGHILHVLGRDSEALPLFAPAWNAAYRFDSPGNPHRRLLVADARQACESLGKPDAASAWDAARDTGPDEAGIID